MLESDIDVNREPTSPEEATSIIERIAAHLGDLPPTIKTQFAGLPSEGRDYAYWLADEKRKANEKLIKLYGHLQRTAIVLTDSIYRTVNSIYAGGWRYLYELIQNADDASYSKAAQSGESSSLTFALSSECLVISTNEDGFTTANVRALCAISESSKKLSAGDESIGEKGIGFKSVFSVAREVSIQSGHWSFCFTNDKKDPLSIIIPRPVRHTPLQPGVRTCIRLRYFDGLHQQLAEDLQALSHNTLMFLKKLSKLQIIVDGTQKQKSPSGTRQFIRQHTTVPESLHARNVTLQVSINDSEATVEERKWYYVHSCGYSDLPRDERRHSTHAEVQLAFPVSADGFTPSLSGRGEEMFAFLPMLLVRQIPFAVHSDFITTSSRENAVGTSWNLALFERVARAFVDAVRSFVTRGLKFAWLDYLPDTDIETLWSALPRHILTLLRSEKMLERWMHPTLVTPDRVYLLPDCFIHDSKPLFHDSIRSPAFLSPTYTENCYTEKLSRLDVRELLWSEMLDEVERDVSSPNSKLKSTKYDDEWYIGFAHFIECAYDVTDPEEASSIDKRISQIQLIPLSNGDWATPSDRVYYPFVDGQEIPKNLGLRLVDSKAVRSGDLRRMYDLLRVTDCDPEVIVSSIMNFQTVTPWKGRTYGMTRDLKLQLKFLHYSGKVIENNDSQELIFVTSANVLTRARKGLYFPSQDKFDTQSLLKAVLLSTASSPGSNSDVILQGTFCNRSDARDFFHGRTWEQWLSQVCNVRYFPPLKDPDNLQLHPILEQVRKVDSVLFLAILQKHWAAAYSTDARLAGNQLLRDLSAKHILCSNGEECTFNASYFPSQNLSAVATDLGIRQMMPFLELSEESAIVEDWEFLPKLGVRFDPDLNFWLHALASVKQSSALSPDEKQRSVAIVYENIGKIANADNAAVIKDKFQQLPGICNPRNSSDWRSAEACVWEGHEFMSSLILLQERYRGSEYIASLFQNTLKVRNAHLDDILNELEYIRDNELWKRPQQLGKWNTAIDLMRYIYGTIAKSARSDKAKAKVKAKFEQKLIFVASSWFRPVDCVWDLAWANMETPMIRDIYSSLQSFFVDVVGVSVADASWLLEQILACAASTTPNLAKLKSLTIELGIKFVTNDTGDAAEFESLLGQLKTARFMPVKKSDGGVSLCSIHDSFIIGDRPSYATKFAAHADMLDFDDEEVRKLHCLFLKLNLQNAYISTKVTTTSRPVSSELDEERTDDFRKRSYALACCAAKYKSNLFIGDTTTYERLLMTTVHTSDDLRTELRLRLANGKSVTATAEQSAPTIQGTRGGDIIIYLPNDPKDLDHQYSISLPGLLRELLGIGDQAADILLYHLIRRNLHEIYGILESFEAPFLRWLDRIELPEPPQTTLETQSATSSASIDSSDGFQGGQNATPSTANISSTSVHISSENTREYVQVTEVDARVSAGFARSTSTLPVRPQPAQLTSESIEAAYLRLLQNVLRAARGEAPSDSGSGLFIQDFQTALQGFDEPAYRSKLGAAGELFVYESLRRLNLPGFGFENWPSKIRHYVTVLDEYKNMPSFTGNDMDIMVQESNTDVLEQWLRRHSPDEFPSSLSRSNYRGSIFGYHAQSNKLRYELEIKSTGGACSNVLFMSHNQYNRVNVFVLVRVYDLFTWQPKLKVFVDPVRLKDRSLKFEGAAWQVRVTV
ncbi:MAG: hypothetical protein Q9159_001155 [Coniocarpon cinnabarinum]